MRWLFIVLFTSFLLPLNGVSQTAKEERRAAKQQKYIQKQQRKKDKKKAKELKKAEKEAFKRYYSIQCKDVRKRLKKQRRKSQKKKGGSASPGKVKKKFTRKK